MFSGSDFAAVDGASALLRLADVSREADSVGPVVSFFGVETEVALEAVEPSALATTGDGDGEGEASRVGDAVVAGVEVTISAVSR